MKSGIAHNNKIHYVKWIKIEFYRNQNPTKIRLSHSLDLNYLQSNANDIKLELIRMNGIENGLQVKKATSNERMCCR